MQANLTGERVDLRTAELLRNLAGSLTEEMSYSLFAGGKRLRPNLLIAACASVSGGYSETALDFACAAEMIHTYSLIHDDLPAMDNDDLRRGKPTSHIKFGEAAAILAGDALLNLAFEVMLERVSPSGETRGANTINAARAMRIIARASGASGMIAGQAADMRWEGRQADGDTLLYIHSHKTGALITACAEAGAVLGGASDEARMLYRELGKKLGLAFQIKDDLLDVTATEAELGKPARSDEKNKKNTYVTVFGMERALADYKKTSGEIMELLKKIPRAAGDLPVLVGDILKNNFA